MPSGPFQFVWLGVADACKAPMEKRDSKLLTGKSLAKSLVQTLGGWRIGASPSRVP